MVFFKKFICFFNIAKEAYLEINEPFSTLKIVICWKFPFGKVTQFSQEAMCEMLQLLTQMIFFVDIQVFLQLSSIGLFGDNRSYLHLQTHKF
jgi:hypothetical protein